jgi:hypothetical protein
MKSYMFTTTRAAAFTVGALMLSPFATQADTIDPTSFTANLGVGESVTIEKTVVIADAPTAALIDVHFLFDTSGSMGGRINGVKAAAADIFTGLDALGDVAASVGVYSEAARLAPAGSVPGRVINQDTTTDSATAIAAINAVTLGNPDGGGDGPENGVNGIEFSVENLSWRPGSNRFLFAFGDIGFKTSDESETVGGFTATGMDFDTNDDQDGAPISTAANAIEALTLNSVNLFGFGPTGSFAGAINTLGGDFIDSGTDPAEIVADIIDSVTGSFAEYNTVTVSDLGAGLPFISVSTVCTGADTGACVDSDAVGDYDRSVDRTFTFDVTFTREAAGTAEFNTLALVDGGAVASEFDRFPGDDFVPTPAPSALALMGLGLGMFGFGATRRRRAA